MKIAFAGRDATVIETREVFSRDLGPLQVVGGDDQAMFDVLLQVGQQLPGIPSLPTELEHRVVDACLHPLGVAWLVTTKQPGLPQMPFHASDTLGLDTILAGRATLLLTDAEIELEAGDMAIIEPYVVHSWRGSDEGYTMAGVFFAVPASGDDTR